MSIPGGPKGTRDFYPEVQLFQEYLFTSWQKTCKRYSFEPYEAPMFEHLEIYTQKSGAEIEKQLYTFEDKGGRMMALRPEMTPSLARMVAAKGQNLKKPVRWYSIARLFRYEKMQKGRLREFFQLNMDILGSAEVSADAELIAAVIDMLRDLGLDSCDVQVRISSRTLLEECFTLIGLSKEACVSLYALLDRKGKISEEEYQADLAIIVADAALRSKISLLFQATSIEDVERIIGPVESANVLRELFSMLDKYGMAKFACFDIGIVRGLAYYTGTVFEVFAVDKGMRAIAGGGRYDKLVELYGGAPTPAVGFAAGDVVLGDLLREKGLVPAMEPRCRVFTVAIDEQGYSALVPLVQELRGAGIPCEFPFRFVNIGKQLKQADGAGAEMAVFVGGTEMAEGNYRIKKMKSGEELTVAQNRLVETLRLMLKVK
jgi:histidyl-tRNA synthetase